MPTTVRTTCGAAIRRAATLAAAAFALLGPATLGEGAWVSRSGLPRIDGGDSPVAVDAAGRPHVVYGSEAGALRHSWRESGRWIHETVEEGPYSGSDCSIAVDSAGRIHVAYVAGREDPFRWVLMYGVRDEAGWTLSEVSEGGFGPSIVVDADDRPRILHVRGEALEFAVWTGASWTLVNTGRMAHSFMGTSLVLDGSGHAHATFGTNTQLSYGTDAGGAWEAVPLGDGGAYASVALDGAGRPQVIAAYMSGVASSTLERHWKDESGWHGEVLLDADADGVMPGHVAAVSDAAGDPSFLFSLAPSGGGSESTLFAHFDGVVLWAIPVQWRNAGGHMSLVRTADGTLHGTYQKSLRGDRVRPTYTRLRLPDVAASWGPVVVTPTADGVHVEGTVRVRNLGPGTSKPVVLRLHVSGDDLFGPDDLAVGRSRKVKGIRPGTEREMPVSLDVPGPVAGLRLLAVLDPDVRRPDVDRLNNVAVLPLGE